MTRLYYKFLQSGVVGKVYDIIKSMYSNNNVQSELATNIQTSSLRREEVAGLKPEVQHLH